jgi:hypothetical protein
LIQPTQCKKSAACALSDLNSEVAAMSGDRSETGFLRELEKNCSPTSGNSYKNLPNVIPLQRCHAYLAAGRQIPTVEKIL